LNKSKKLGLPLLVALTMAIAMAAPSGASASVGDPILFVHGWSGSASQFDGLKAKFASAGWSSSQLATLSYNTYTSNKTVAASIKTAVDKLLAANPGKTKVDLISHSMGGMSTRYYVENLGGLTKVKTYVSLAGANHGTNFAYLCALYGDPGCTEMIPGSAFLKALNAGDETPGSINYATWWSPDDGIIIPATSTPLAGAQNTEVPGVAHNDEMNNPTISAGVLSYVTAH
jgi:triacylglycerol lipase